ncbi:DUF882 domain-containing protein [Vibrio sp. JC009]|uniref:DUF882 domain-containing protein n=1 Tax=Vibrio sp. JC009 TaxID=2912314 RepID=UPI0023AEE635|nr:DUF882 domain-containing protein [Vibrio sp. JC009]WED20578.1 DUF882 domain-containing protein [Vibrio sp. JC009]
MLSRRNFLKLTTGSVALASIAPSIVLASSVDKSQMIPREISLNNLHTGERLKTCFFDGENFVEEALDDIARLCRDFRRNEVFPIDKRLLVQLDNIRNQLGTTAEIQIISGYRSPATNEMLAAKSGGVAKKSMHMRGKAIDFRIPGVDLKKVQKVALAQKAGGVGYYEKSNFVHIDTGRVRFW